MISDFAQMTWKLSWTLISAKDTTTSTCDQFCKLHFIHFLENFAECCSTKNERNHPSILLKLERSIMLNFRSVLPKVAHVAIQRNFAHAWLFVEMPMSGKKSLAWNWQASHFLLYCNLDHLRILVSPLLAFLLLPASLTLSLSLTLEQQKDSA